jgi:hypothetical protein
MLGLITILVGIFIFLKRSLLLGVYIVIVGIVLVSQGI